MIDEIVYLSVDDGAYEKFQKISEMYGGNDSAFQVVMKAHEVILNTGKKNDLNLTLSEDTDKWLDGFVANYEHHEDAFKVLADMFSVGNAIFLSAHFPMPHHEESKQITLKSSELNKFVEKVKKYNA